MCHTYQQVQIYIFCKFVGWRTNLNMYYIAVMYYVQLQGKKVETSFIYVRIYAICDIM